MSNIEKCSGVFTLVNVFTVAPDRQGELVALLVDATEQTMRHLPGFVSANIHRSLDGKKVVNYAQWESAAAFEAMRNNPLAIPHMRAASALAQAEPIPCEVAESISGVDAAADIPAR